MKTRFLELANKIEREGNKEYLEYLEGSGFYTAPASGSYHLNREGGLVEHSLNVCLSALALNKAWGNKFSEETILISSLYHDDGKAGFRGEPFYEDNVLKSGKISEPKPYRRNKNMLPLIHEMISVLNISKYMELTGDEMWAILQHNGMYGDLRYNLQGNETGLQIIVHASDMWASRVLEI